MTQLAKHEPQSIAPTDAPMVAMIERLAMDPNIPLDRLEQMLAMKERMDAKSAEKAFAAAFAAASANFPNIPMNGKGHNQMPYAKLKDIIACTRPILAAHGLILTWNVETSDKVRVTAKLAHTDGHSQATSIVLPSDSSGSKNAVQAFGSTQTYGQRYTAQAILGLSLGEDAEDDGRGAETRPNSISAEQYVALRNKAELAGVDEAKICLAAGVPDLHQFPAKDYAAAMARLDKNIAAKGGAA